MGAMMPGGRVSMVATDMYEHSDANLVPVNSLGSKNTHVVADPNWRTICVGVPDHTNTILPEQQYTPATDIQLL